MSVAPRRPFEGWQLGLLAVSLPLLALWLALPRPVDPELVPLPAVDRGEIRASLDAELARARAAEGRGLPFEVRVVGEFVRRHGRARTANDRDAVTRTRLDLPRLARAVRARHGAERLLDLRAVQTALFLGAVDRFRATGRADTDLSELWGNFASDALREGWLDAQGRLALSDVERFVVFRVRWTELAGALEDPVLRLGLQDFRVLYRLRLERPAGDTPLEQDRRRLSAVAALAERDSDYPAALARGVLLFRLGEPAAAANEFLAHLSAAPDGPFALRARNHALAALAQARALE